MSNTNYLEQWLQGEEIKFPSGKKAVVATIDPLSIVQQDGEIPNFLIDVMNGTEASSETLGQEGFSGLVAIMNNVARAAFVNPPVVETLDEQRDGKGIHISRISLQDKFFLLEWAMGGIEASNVKKSSATDNDAG